MFKNFRRQHIKRARRRGQVGNQSSLRDRSKTQHGGFVQRRARIWSASPKTLRHRVRLWKPHSARCVLAIPCFVMTSSVIVERSIGEGNSKKSSKKCAAEAMLKKLNELPTLPQSIAKSKKQTQNKKKNRNLIKVLFFGNHSKNTEISRFSSKLFSRAVTESRTRIWVTYKPDQSIDANSASQQREGATISFNR